MATFAIILLARINFVQGRSVGAKLEILYDMFVEWCRANGKSSSLDGFSLLKFKMKTFLAWASESGLGLVDFDLGASI